MEVVTSQHNTIHRMGYERSIIKHKNNCRRSFYHVSPISLLIEEICLHPSKLKISLTSATSASDGISLRIIVLRPAALILGLIRSSTIFIVDLSSALRRRASSVVSAFIFANCSYNMQEKMLRNLVQH